MQRATRAFDERSTAELGDTSKGLVFVVGFFAVLACGCSAEKTGEADSNSSLEANTMQGRDPACRGETLALRASQAASRMTLPRSKMFRVPQTLKNSSKMGETVLEFHRPDRDPVRCVYRAASSAALELASCDHDAVAGSFVEASDLAVQASSTSGAIDLAVALCHRPVPEMAKVAPGDPPGVTINALGESVLPTATAESARVEWKPAPFAFDQRRMDQFRSVAEQSAVVAELLGKRFAYIQLDPVEPPKGQSVTAYEAVLTYYSYDLGAAVKVAMRNGEVLSAQRSEEWPTEGASEVAESVALARKAPALAGRLNDLQGGAMLAQPVDGTENWGKRRILDVRFFTPGTTVTHYEALVDLTNQQVLSAKPVVQEVSE